MTQTQGTLHISPINPAVTYHIPVQINGYTCSFIVDTEAAVTLINSLMWTHCKLTGQSSADLLSWNQQRLVGVDRSSLQVKGYVSVQLNCGGHNFVASVIVVKGITEEAIGTRLPSTTPMYYQLWTTHVMIIMEKLSNTVDFAMQIITRSTPATAVLKETIIVPALQNWKP